MADPGTGSTAENPHPLREGVADATVDLQEALHLVYDRAYYKDYIYQGKPNPPLHPDDQTWAESLFKGLMKS